MPGESEVFEIGFFETSLAQKGLEPIGCTLVIWNINKKISSIFQQVSTPFDQTSQVVDVFQYGPEYNPFIFVSRIKIFNLSLSIEQIQ